MPAQLMVLNQPAWIPTPGALVGLQLDWNLILLDDALLVTI